MRTVWLTAFSIKGVKTAERVAEILSLKDFECQCYAPEKYRTQKTLPMDADVRSWAGEAFEKADALIFCCACGIAVRAIAPWLKSKSSDPAVIVMDELAKFVIPLLSGHIGGANELALLLAEELGCAAVITTATDINEVFSVDVFAKKNHLKINSMQLAKEVSAALLSGTSVGFASDISYSGKLPEGLVSFSNGSGGDDVKLGICISADLAKKPFKNTLNLIPQSYVIGTGCRKNKSFRKIESFLLEELKQNNIGIDEIRFIASIDLKKDEPALTRFAEKYGIEFICFTAEELAGVPGEFTASEFVRSNVGVDCVCERAALKAGAKELIQKKTAANGMTFALGKYEEVISFE